MKVLLQSIERQAAIMIGSCFWSSVSIQFCTSQLGLSVVQSDRVTGKLPLKGDALLTRKLGTLNVIEAMQLAPELTYPLYVAAASDSQEPVAKRGEELLKRKAAGANLDDSDLIKRLFMLFNGNVGVENVAEESKVAPANPALRARLMSVFCRSITAANSFPLTLQCIFGCIYGTMSHFCALLVVRLHAIYSRCTL